MEGYGGINGGGSRGGAGPSICAVISTVFFISCAQMDRELSLLPRLVDMM